MLCLGLIGRKMTRPFQLIPFRPLLLLPLQGKGMITLKLFPCSHQIIESLTPPIHDNAWVVCKSITMSEIEPNSDSTSCSDPSWNLKCMTMLDWVKAQTEDQIISHPIQWDKARAIT